jgi:peptidoglycan/xylan/chitin deacetylase (PgdA/CDA1 family)
VTAASTARALIRRTGARRKLAGARMFVERQALSRLGTASAPAKGRILCYHSVGTPSWGVNDVPPALFRSHIELALAAGFKFVPARIIADGKGDARSLAITFDDGLATVATEASPILLEYNIPASLYVVSAWSSGDHHFGADTILEWRELERLAGAGISIGSHSVTHPNFGRLNPEKLVDELGRSRDSIRAALGFTVDEFAIPFGQSRNWTAKAMEVAREVGYAVVYAQSEKRRPRGTVPRTFITRFDNPAVFGAALRGRFDDWEEWM